MRGNRELSRAPVLVALLLLLTTAGASALRAGNLDVPIKLSNVKDIELAKLMSTIAQLTKTNILVDPQEARTKVTLRLMDVPARRAIDLIAKLNKLEVRDEQGDGSVLIIARPETLESSFDKGLTKTIPLRYAKATDMASILQKALAKAGQVSIEVDERTNSLIVSGTKRLIESVEELRDELDKPVPQVLIDSKIVSVQTNVLSDIGFNWDWGTGFNTDGDQEVNASGGSGSLFTISERFRRNNNPDYYQAEPNGAEVFRFGDFFRGNLFFDAVFRALERSSIARNLASPRVLAVNGAKAQLSIGDEIIFSGGPSQGPESKETGIVLDIEPRINRDGFITMDVSVEQSSAQFRASDFPTITKTQAKTKVQVRDGEEVLIGGLVTETSNSTEERIPFLSDIPVVKHLFIRKRSEPETKELVILMTPRVIKQNLPGVGEATGGGGFGGDDMSLGGGDLGGGDFGGGDFGGGDLGGGDLGGGDLGGGDLGLGGGLGDDDLGFDDDDFGGLD